MTVDPRIARWLAPVPSPLAEPRSHATFDAIRGETSKLDSATAGAPDWSLVIGAADEHLRTVSKDVLVGASLAAALGHREGAQGVAVGAALLGAMLGDASLPPLRPRARANALALFVGRADVALAASTDRRPEVARGLVESIATLDRVAREALGDDAPSLRPLSDHARRIVESIPAPVAPAPVAPPPVAPVTPGDTSAEVAAAPRAVFEPPPPLPAASSSSAPPATSPEGPPDRASDVPAFLRRTSQHLVVAAGLLRVADPLDESALRLLWAALYAPISAAPEPTKGDRTALPAPPRVVLEGLARADAAAPEIAAREALATLERHRFALDAHAVLARALERAGARAERARDAHRRVVVDLVLRLPALEGRAFADGTPFASESTRAWLASLTAPPAASTAPPSHAEPSIESALAPARELSESGRHAEALAAIEALRRASRSGRERLSLTLELAALAEKARAGALAEELLVGALAEVDARDLDRWEPALAASVHAAVLRLVRALPGREPLAKASFARLAALDPAAAIEFAAPHATPPKPGR